MTTHKEAVLWRIFEETGSVEDYLLYKKARQEALDAGDADAPQL